MCRTIMFAICPAARSFKLGVRELVRAKSSIESSPSHSSLKYRDWLKMQLHRASQSQVSNRRAPAVFTPNLRSPLITSHCDAFKRLGCRIFTRSGVDSVVSPCSTSPSPSRGVLSLYENTRNKYITLICKASVAAASGASSDQVRGSRHAALCDSSASPHPSSSSTACLQPRVHQEASRGLPQHRDRVLFVLPHSQLTHLHGSSHGRGSFPGHGHHHDRSYDFNLSHCIRNVKVSLSLNQILLPALTPIARSPPPPSPPLSLSPSLSLFLTL